MQPFQRQHTGGDMDKLLILMRHAKAVDRLEAEDDFQRGLTARGRSDSEDAAATFAQAGVKADLALVSPSWRTRQTFDLVRETLGEPAVEDPMALYHASTEMLERAVLGAFERVDRVILVGHNPGIGGFAHALAARSGTTRDFPAGYPTATAAGFSLAGSGFDAPKLLFAFNPKA